NQPVRAPLPAQVERRDAEAALLEIGDGFEIFLDEFGAPLDQDDSAARHLALPGENGGAQAYGVAGREISDLSAVRNGIGWKMNQARFAVCDGHVHRRAPA